MVQNLRKLRIQKGISQQQLAEAIGVTQQSINKYENHSVEPDIFTLKAMAHFFNTSVDYLVGNTALNCTVEMLQKGLLTDDEVDMLNAYRLLNEKQKSSVKVLLDSFSSI